MLDSVTKQKVCTLAGASTIACCLKITVWPIRLGDVLSNKEVTVYKGISYQLLDDCLTFDAVPSQKAFPANLVLLLLCQPAVGQPLPVFEIHPIAVQCYFIQLLLHDTN